MMRRRRFLGASALCGAAPWARARVGTGVGQDKPALRVGATPGPNADILAHLAQQDQAPIALRVALHDDPRALATELARGHLDAACFADGVRFADEVRARREPLVAVATTVTLPMALYSRRLVTPRALRQGDAIALPQDPPGLARALVLLQNFGLLTLRDDIGLHATLRDVAGNRRALRLQPLPAAALYGALDRSAVAVMASDTATRAGLQPGRDSIGVEDARSPWAGVLAVRRDRASEPWVAPLLQAWRSEDVKRFVLERWHDSVRRPW